MTFEAACKVVFPEEGGNVLVDLHDGASDTFCGITRTNFPHWIGWPMIDQGDRNSDTLNQAVKDFYLTEFWSPLQCDQLPDCVANLVFDFSINAGLAEGAKALQRAALVNPDGQIGAITIAACRNADQAKLFDRLIAQQLRYYLKCKGWQTFHDSWVNRVADELEKL